MKKVEDNIYLFSGINERTNKLFNSLRVGVLLQGREAEILFSNKAATTLLGLTEAELYGRSSFSNEWDVIHEDGTSFPGPTHPVPVAIKTRKSVSNVIMGFYRPLTKDRVWLLVNAEPLLDDTGHVKEVICSFSDITEQKANEEKLNWLYQNLEIRAYELATSNADLERFLYVATHDLQEPLRLINSFTELLRKKYGKQLDEQANEYINYAVEGATRMKKLILDLLEYSKFSNNREEFSQIDINMVLKNVSQIFSNEIKDADAKLIFQELPVITANLALITQLFENLIGNALKFRRDCKLLIQVNCKVDSENYIFSVSDNGIGINPKYSEKIFILFRRLHSDTKAFEGTGVGLAICKKIAELHRGDIWVESEQGKGSTFYFTIPRKQNQVNERL